MILTHEHVEERSCQLQPHSITGFDALCTTPDGQKPGTRTFPRPATVDLCFHHASSRLSRQRLEEARFEQQCLEFAARVSGQLAHAVAPRWDRSLPPGTDRQSRRVDNPVVLRVERNERNVDVPRARGNGPKKNEG